MHELGTKYWFNRTEGTDYKSAPAGINMKTIILITLICACMVFITCCKTLFPDEKLTIKKRDYIGSELRTDGYYYCYFNQTDITAILFLYRNGVALVSSGYLSCSLDSIERRIINENFNRKSDWGVFVVDGNIIQWERWIGSLRPNARLSRKTGKIISDTTIHFTKIYSSEYETTCSIDEFWHFKQFDNKPDSTNNFIKYPPLWRKFF